MLNKIGRFEIVSEIATSTHGVVYKASDPESGQTVALKTLSLEGLGEQGAGIVESLLQEADITKVLNSHNIALLYGAGEIEGKFCASTEYVQGNSIATMMARKEGFSIWDIQDIVRQTCQGLDHAHIHKAVHYSMEPAKIMVQWDGTVKLLGFGVSTMGAHAAQASGPAPEVLHYMSPEQLRGDPLDARSNLFSLGAILYEMVTEHKAFAGESAEQVRQAILEATPQPPAQVNRKIHPALSEVVMKAIAKSPEERYQSGQELVNDLERCKESATKSATKPTPQPVQGVSKPAAANVSVPKPASVPVAKPAPASVAQAAVKPVVQKKAEAPVTAPASPEFEVSAAPRAEERPKAAAAAAGWSGGSAPKSVSNTPASVKLDPTAQFISTCVKASVEALTVQSANLSASTVEPEAPAIAPEPAQLPVDPMMAEPQPSTAPAKLSFSEMTELPPLKEAYVAPPPPPVAEEAAPPAEPLPATVFRGSAVPEKPKVQPREAAKKAVKEIKKTPPKLFMYSITAAIGIILLIIVAIAFHIHSENADDEGGGTAATAVPAQPVQTPAAAAPAPEQPPAQTITVPERVQAESEVLVKPKYKDSKKKLAKAPAAAPALLPGELTVNSNPEGAQITFDGKNESAWTTPFSLAGISAGPHTLTVSKPGYGTDTRTIEVASASKATLTIQLAALMAQASVASEPSGATIIVDGKDTGRVTPAQLSVEKAGNHTLLVRKQGYLDETTTVNLQLGQIYHYSPTLHALGQTDDIKTVSKFKKVFGGGDTSAMGMVSIKTSPKGAQIAVNRRIVDKSSPLEFYLNPGTYVVDLSLSGYKDVHRVINVDKGGKAVIEETLEHQ